MDLARRLVPTTLYDEDVSVLRHVNRHTVQEKEKYTQKKKVSCVLRKDTRIEPYAQVLFLSYTCK